MSDLDQKSLFSHLREYRDVFTFGPEEMPSMALTIIEHRLNMNPLHRQVVQKKSHMGPKRVVVTNAEV